MEKIKTYVNGADYTVQEIEEYANSKYLIGTTTPPPQLEAHEVTQWQGKDKGWVIMPDYRGTVLYSKADRQRIEIKEVNQTPEDFPDYTILQPYEYCYWDKKANCWADDVEVAREGKYNSLSNGFREALANGSFFSKALGIEVDCRRGDDKNDLQNVEGLINYMERNKIESAAYVGKTASATIDAEQLKTLVYEMQEYVIGLYNKKWTLEAAAKKALTVEELDAIAW